VVPAATADRAAKNLIPDGK